jgi:hypothetical protein
MGLESSPSPPWNNRMIKLKSARKEMNNEECKHANKLNNEKIRTIHIQKEPKNLKPAGNTDDYTASTINL